MKQGLYDMLKEYSKSGYLPMHMPGHKRNSDFLRDLPAEIDITEIDGFDNLHAMEGVLLDLAKLAAELYGAKMCYPVVNGSSAAILAAVTHATKGRGRLLMARNCHKAVYNAAAINRLDVSYIYPKVDENGIAMAISPKEVEAMLWDDPSFDALILTSPTFEGVVSDISGISEVCRKRGVKLIVDAAHGAHFGFDESFPQNPVRQGADYTVMSLHKTLPALTQCALLAIGEDVDEEGAAYALSIYETTSPSYVLMASMDECLRTMRDRGGELLKRLTAELKEFYERCRELKHIKVLHYDDISRITLLCKGTQLSGSELADILRHEYKIEPEMAYADRVVLITTICDEKAAFDRLLTAICEIDGKCEYHEPIPPLHLPAAKSAMSLWEGSFAHGEEVPLSLAIGRVCGEYIFAYPPGIPIIAAGERVTDEVLEFMRLAKRHKVELHGTRSVNGGIFITK